MGLIEVVSSVARLPTLSILIAPDGFRRPERFPWAGGIVKRMEENSSCLLIVDPRKISAESVSMAEYGERVVSDVSRALGILLEVGEEGVSESVH